MNILPQQLIGKTVKDCYQDHKGKVVIEFTDGIIIEIVHQDQSDYYRGHEISIPVIL